jgi:hypothetical protein
VHRSFTISGDAIRARRQLRPANQLRAIRAKNRFWRAPMRREGGGHENFFIAKTRDSESTQSALWRSPRCAMMSAASRSSNASFAKTPAAQAFPAISTVSVACFRVLFACLRDWFAVLSINAARALSLWHVNTSLSGTLFFSMCWCIRDVVHFDSRVHAAIKPSHYIRRATWPRKLRRQRRRRAQ